MSLDVQAIEAILKKNRRKGRYVSMRMNTLLRKVFPQAADPTLYTNELTHFLFVCESPHIRRELAGCNSTMNGYTYVE